MVKTKAIETWLDSIQFWEKSHSGVRPMRAHTQKHICITVFHRDWTAIDGTATWFLRSILNCCRSQAYLYRMRECSGAQNVHATKMSAATRQHFQIKIAQTNRDVLLCCVFFLTHSDALTFSWAISIIFVRTIRFELWYLCMLHLLPISNRLGVDGFLLFSTIIAAAVVVQLDCTVIFLLLLFTITTRLSPATRQFHWGACGGKMFTCNAVSASTPMDVERFLKMTIYGITKFNMHCT